MITHDNIYIDSILQYTRKHTPVIIQVNTSKYHEICQHIKTKELSNSKKELITAIYTLFYTALDCHRKAKFDTNNLQYYILLGDYISSYCTEILYENNMYDLLEVFAQNSKRVIFDQMSQKESNYLLVAILNTI